MFSKIKDIQIGDYVLSYNHEGKLEYKKVTDRMDNGFRQVYKYITKSGKTVLSTSNHRVLQVDHNSNPYYAEIGSVDYLVNVSESSTIQDSIVEKCSYGVHNVIDIEVEDNHNFVLDGGTCVHNSRAGAQTPFSSLNYGTDTSAEGRLVISKILDATWDGLGNGETPIFPIQIFKLKEGVSYNPKDKNYDLFKKACKVSAKRLFPNFSFLDAPYNLQYYKANDYKTEIAYMGCVDGTSTSIWEINGKSFLMDFEVAWEYFSAKFKVSQENSKVCNWIKLENVKIFDSTSKKFVPCYKIIRNHSVQGLELVTSTQRKLIVTLDHPLNVYQKGRMYAKDICVGDKIETSETTNETFATLLIGRGISDTQYDTVETIQDTTFSKGYSYDVTTETERFDANGFASWNCRTRVMSNVHDRSREIVTGRGNLSFTSLNLPRLAIETKLKNKGIEYFYHKLDETVNLIFRQLLDRLEIQSKKKVKNFPFLMGQGVWMDSENFDTEDTLKEVLKHGTLTVGFIGLAETLKMLTGKHHGESDDSQKLGLEIIGHIRKMCDDKAQETGLNFSLIATPSEGLSGRFVRIDKEKYGIIEGVTDRDYYTNSFHVPVYYPISAFKKLEIEGKYHALTNAGHISYIEMDGDPLKNMSAFESIVRCMHDNGIGYGAINHPIDTCTVCGYTGIINDTCPRCGRKDGEGVDVEKLKKLKKIYPSIRIPKCCS